MPAKKHHLKDLFLPDVMANIFKFLEEDDKNTHLFFLMLARSLDYRASLCNGPNSLYQELSGLDIHHVHLFKDTANIMKNIICTPRSLEEIFMMIPGKPHKITDTEMHDLLTTLDTHIRLEERYCTYSPYLQVLHTIQDNHDFLKHFSLPKYLQIAAFVFFIRLIFIAPLTLIEYLFPKFSSVNVIPPILVIIPYLIFFFMSPIVQRETEEGLAKRIANNKNISKIINYNPTTFFKIPKRRKALETDAAASAAVLVG